VLQERIEAGHPNTPILVVTPEDDLDDFFLRNLQAIARSKQVKSADGRIEQMIRRTFFIDAAPSQRSMVVSLIQDAYRDGGWIVCTNVALSEEFAVELDEVVAGMENQEKEPDPNFRLILQTPTTDLLPTSLIRKSTKIGLSRRWGLRQQFKDLALHLDEFFKTPGSATGLSEVPRLDQFGALLPCLVIFHTLVTERGAATNRSAGGDTPWYGKETLSAAVRELVRMLQQHPPGHLPVEAVRVQVAEVLYGARHVDPTTRKTLNDLASSCIHEGCKGDDYRFGPDDAHVVGNVQHLFLKYAESLHEDPTTDPNLLLLGSGMLASEGRARAAHFCEQIQSLSMPYVPPTRAEAEPIVRSVRQAIPKRDFNPDAAFEWLGTPETPVLMVLFPLMQQELRRYSLLLSSLRRDLERLEVWLRGEMVLPPELESDVQRLVRGAVPRSWLELSGCTKPTDVAKADKHRPALAAWLEWLIQGYNFFDQWSVEGVQPHVLDLGAFIDPFAVLRAIVDQCADAEGASAADVELHVHILDASQAQSSPRGGIDGTQAFFVTGLWMRHAEWDNDARTLCHPESVRASELLPAAEIRARKRASSESEVFTRAVIYRDFAHRSQIGELMLPPTIEGPSHWDSHGLAISTVPW